MALLNLKIHDVSISTDAAEKTEKSVILTTEETTDTDGNACGVQKMVQFTVINKDKKEELKNYQLSLMNLQFTKKMYQPTNIIAEIAVFKAIPRSSWIPVPRDQVVSVFQGKKVSIWDRTQLKQDGSAFDHMKVGEDFYVHSVQVKYKVNYMRIYLQICSLDKLMTLEKNCRTFVGKKLKAGILASELPSDAEKSKYVAPYDSKKPLAFDASKMQNLSYDSTEHIFPYLVQYNESFYDMLARTTNRWGEFMFYEDGKLNIGCPNSTVANLTPTEAEIAAQAKDKDSIKYPDFDTLAYYDVYEHENGNKYDCAASYDDNMLCSPIQKEPNSVSGNIVWPFNVKWDKVVMKKFTSFFKNDKNLPTFLGGELFNDLYDLGSQKATVYQKNKKHLDDYFKEADVNTKKEQYGKYKIKKDKMVEGYNPFSEIKTIYDKAKYFSILKHEISVGKNAICISYDTSYPCLKLGQIIKVYDKEYIVTQIDCSTDTPLMLQDDLWVITTDPVKYSFHVYAIPKLEYQTKDKDGKVVESVNQFFPTVIPSGHVRLAEPQMATVTDAKDPNGSGRVRVMFGWQDVIKENDKISDATKAASSPWLQFTANAGGKDGIMGKHYEGDTVFVGFIDGNVERPYVIGALSKGAGADIHCKTPGGHTLKIEDNSAGISAFLTRMFLPIWGTLSDFIPGMREVNAFKNNDNNLSMAGGFTLTDNYGIYKISGSTDGRNVSIASPWGDVSVNAFTGISISAPNGDISIKGKNVSIEAGNNLSLVSGKNVGYRIWKKKDTWQGELAQFITDLPVTVAKKLAEKAINVVDLSIIRSVVEVVFRPVEGCLTLKSNRFMKLEAGKNKCEYPYTAYSASKVDQQKKLDAKEKKAILAGTGEYLGVIKGTVDLFKSISGLVEDLDTKFEKQYNECVGFKAALKNSLDDLKPWSNDQTQEVCNKTFADLYKGLIDDLWAMKDKYEPFDEAKLDFSDNVKSDENDASNCVDDACFDRLGTLVMFKHPFKGGFLVADGDGVDLKIVLERKKLKQKAVDALNRLGLGIWQLQHIEFQKTDMVTKPKNGNISWYTFTPVPENYKTMLANAFSRKMCPNSIYYKPIVDEGKRQLDTALDTSKQAFSPKDKVYMKRLVAMNLLEELGFKDEWRKKIQGRAVGVIPAPPEPVVPAKPDASTMEDRDGTIMNDMTWEYYVQSLSGIPKFKKDKTALGSTLEKVAGEALDKIWFFKGWGENCSYSEGKNGEILIGTDKSTYVLNKEGVKPANVLESTIKCLNDIDGAVDGLDAKQKSSVQGFVQQIRDVIKDY